MKAVLLLALLYATPSFAQNISVRAGTPINKAIPLAQLYQYPQFRTGRILYKDGRSTGSTLNYHRVFDEMQFLGVKGDTLALSNEGTIQLITIEKDTFYYADGFIRLLGATPNVKLAKKQWLKLMDREKYGGYGQTYSGTDIVNVKMLDDGKQVHQLTVKENVVFAPTVQYYFGDRWDHFVLASKKNVLELFAKHEDAIRNYMKQTKVDFKKEEDVQALFAFLAKL
jgi:hypothetical protein